MKLPDSVDAAHAFLKSQSYVADRSLATSLYLSLKLRRPLFLEGEAGVGKTEIAKVLARGLSKPFIRLQCYEGLDIASAAYEWNYPAQMLHIRDTENRLQSDKIDSNQGIYDRKFLLERPLLQAISAEINNAPVLLIDELDRTDEPFEAYLLELLSDWQITVPELGTLRAAEPPLVIVTSNRTREIHDAIKRRCFYYWVDYPDAVRELEILTLKLPHVPVQLSRQIVAFVQKLRGMNLFKNPGIAETLDWAEALTQLDATVLDPQIVRDTLGVLLKYQDDIAILDKNETVRLLADIKSPAARE